MNQLSVLLLLLLFIQIDTSKRESAIHSKISLKRKMLSDLFRELKSLGKYHFSFGALKFISLKEIVYAVLLVFLFNFLLKGLSFKKGLDTSYSQFLVTMFQLPNENLSDKMYVRMVQNSNNKVICHIRTWNIWQDYLFLLVFNFTNLPHKGSQWNFNPCEHSIKFFNFTIFTRH